MLVVFSLLWIVCNNKSAFPATLSDIDLFNMKVLSRLTWWQIPELGGTTLKLSKLAWAHFKSR